MGRKNFRPRGSDPNFFFDLGGSVSDFLRFSTLFVNVYSAGRSSESLILRSILYTVLGYLARGAREKILAYI